MKSWEVLRDAADKIGVKALAAKLNLSTALIYKWCQENPREDPSSSGARNPLDRVQTIYEATQDARVINWLCHEAGGFFVRNPAVEPEQLGIGMLGTTQRMVVHFGNMLSAISRSVENDGQISADEAEHIREAWEALKAKAEQFVVACEQGLYAGKGRG